MQTQAQSYFFGKVKPRAYTCTKKRFAAHVRRKHGGRIAVVKNKDG